jgi:hypothetical protein
MNEENFSGTIKSYSNLTASTQERIRKFELETKAILRREVTKHQLEARGGAMALDSPDLSSGSIGSSEAAHAKLNESFPQSKFPYSNYFCFVMDAWWCDGHYLRLQI